MSHFVVMVVGDDIEEILAPYDENLEVEGHMDRTKEVIHKEFMNYQGSVIADNKPKECLSDFEKLTLILDTENAKWVMDWCGQELDRYGNTISHYNPDSKWDWYEVGGRWSGTLILKPGCEGSNGSRSWTNKDDVIPANRCDGAYNKDIDWKAMNEIAKQHLAKDWDDLFDPNPVYCKYRPSYVEKQRKKHIEMYGTKENYLKRRGFWTPFALVDEDEWYAPGEMGWWGFSSDETEDRDMFDQMFKEYVKLLNSKDVVTIVDCHI
jgi:hypothetical protein